MEFPRWCLQKGGGGLVLSGIACVRGILKDVLGWGKRGVKQVSGSSQTIYLKRVGFNFVQCGMFL